MLVVVADYLLEHALDRAEELARMVYQAPATLLLFPQRGRPGRKEGTRAESNAKKMPSQAPPTASTE